ncbi:uncharacterized protein B0H18DRAFT_682404 [Fomitopsis serialis]|uniref:uncharacterized protein n=1 Tax=Fomitopsis serialis TaxID=139415 RepID=UPI00200880D7|nr:uncharacterized protein B0H18DRAFT_682404 [Neoantrodia serialis]KAH9918070.1 hypothetical protein B0H18DRAFT_682404 [Neoantrodia serialis]
MGHLCGREQGTQHSFSVLSTGGAVDVTSPHFMATARYWCDSQTPIRPEIGQSKPDVDDTRFYSEGLDRTSFTDEQEMTGPVYTESVAFFELLAGASRVVPFDLTIRCHRSENRGGAPTKCQLVRKRMLARPRGSPSSVCTNIFRPQIFRLSSRGASRYRICGACWTILASTGSPSATYDTSSERRTSCPWRCAARIGRTDVWGAVLVQAEI